MQACLTELQGYCDWKNESWNDKARDSLVFTQNTLVIGENFLHGFCCQRRTKRKYHHMDRGASEHPEGAAVP